MRGQSPLRRLAGGSNATLKLYDLLGREILLIENLTNLDQLPATPFTFQCFPLKVEHADGSPVRAIALLDR